MPKKRTVAEEGLSGTEINEIKSILISFQSGNCSKEQTTRRVIELLKSRKTMNTVVWEDLKDTVEFTGFDWVQTRDLVFYFKIEYFKRSRVNRY